MKNNSIIWSAITGLLVTVVLLNISNNMNLIIHPLLITIPFFLGLISANVMLAILGDGYLFARYLEICQIKTVDKNTNFGLTFPKFFEILFLFLIIVSSVWIGEVFGDSFDGIMLTFAFLLSLTMVLKIIKDVAIKKVQKIKQSVFIVSLFTFLLYLYFLLLDINSDVATIFACFYFSMGIMIALENLFLKKISNTIGSYVFIKKFKIFLKALQSIQNSEIVKKEISDQAYFFYSIMLIVFLFTGLFDPIIPPILKKAGLEFIMLMDNTPPSQYSVGYTGIMITSIILSSIYANIFSVSKFIIWKLLLMSILAFYVVCIMLIVYFIFMSVLGDQTVLLLLGLFGSLYIVPKFISLPILMSISFYSNKDFDRLFTKLK